MSKSDESARGMRKSERPGGLVTNREKAAKVKKERADPIVTISFAVSKRQRRGLAKGHGKGFGVATLEDVQRWAELTIHAWLQDLDGE